MKQLVIITHPDISDSVINKTWRAALQQRPEKFDIHSLYDVYPDLQFDVQQEQALLSKYDTIIFQFPMHWFNVPHGLKKYIDEVLAFGWAFGPGGDKMKGKKIGFAVSTGGTKDTYENMIKLESLLQPMYVSFSYCGCELLATHRLHGATDNPSAASIAQNVQEYIAAF